MAVVGVDAQLVDDFEVVLAPVLDVDQGVVERRAVVALEGVDVAQGLRGVVDIRRDHAVEQALEFAVGELDAVKRLELLAEIGFQRGAVANVRPIGVFEVAQLGDKIKLDLAFRGCHCYAQTCGWGFDNRGSLTVLDETYQHWLPKSVSHSVLPGYTSSLDDSSSRISTL